MTYWLTQSILSDWLYCADSDNRDELIKRIMRLKKEKTTAMQRGIDFETAVTKYAHGQGLTTDLSQTEIEAVRKFGNLCKGGVEQVPISGQIAVNGMRFQCYGICDFVKAGRIFDIKRVSRYEYGKYQHSPQHPMYLELLPEATRFDYLIFDGSRWYIETYRRGDFEPIRRTIGAFVNYLRDTNTMDIFRANWSMTKERNELIHGIYIEKSR